MVITQEPAQSLAALNMPLAAGVCAPREQQDITLPLVIPFGMEMFDIFVQCSPQRALAKEDHLAQALLLHRPDPALGVGIKVRAARRPYGTKNRWDNFEITLWNSVAHSYARVRARGSGEFDLDCAYRLRIGSDNGSHRGLNRAPPPGSTASYRQRPTPGTSTPSRGLAPDRVRPGVPCRECRRQSAGNGGCCRVRSIRRPAGRPECHSPP